MHPNTRACVAYVATKLISRVSSSPVYDYSESRYISISGDVSEAQVSIYDYERGCHFSGTPSSLFDYGRGAHVSLSINGSQFSGYDYGDKHHFSGSVNGSSVTIHDYGESRPPDLPPC